MLFMHKEVNAQDGNKHFPAAFPLKAKLIIAIHEMGLYFNLGYTFIAE